MTSTADGSTAQLAANPSSDDQHIERAWITALRDVAPLALALIPFSLAIGATIASSDVAAPAALAGSLLLMAGAAQLAAVELVDAEAGYVVAVGTALMINARLILYSAAMATWFEGLPRWRRLLLAVPLVDQTFLLAQRRFPGRPSIVWRQQYYIMASGTLLVCFVSSQLVGFWIGAGLPPGLGLHLAAPVAFAGLLGASVKGRGGATAAIAASLAMVIAVQFAGGLALPSAAIFGVVAGSLVAVEES
ncbi:MAG: AzlC family ABC transporter permease [Acidimicrobiales bacterium]